MPEDKATLELRKLEHEIEKLQQEIDAGELEYRLSETELEQSRIELATTKAESLTTRLRERRDAKHYRDELRSLKRREYIFNVGVTSGSVETAIDTLTTWHEEDPTEAFTITFNSPGGSVFDGLRFADFIEYLTGTHHVTTRVSGLAASMAGALLQYGSWRTIGRNSMLHLHEVSTGSLGKASDLLDVAKLAERLTERIAAQYAARSGGRHTAETVHAMMRRHEIYLSAEEAIEHGFADAID